MSLIEKALKFVLDIEGKDTDDPNDPGGLTRFGIAQNYNLDVDVANLTLEGAIAIYKRKYWDSCKCDLLPVDVAFVVFDMAVNQGSDAAIRNLQTALNVLVDGVIGPKTINAAGVNASAVVREFTIRRIIRYTNTKNFNIYGLGWIRRAVLCMVAAGKT